MLNAYLPGFFRNLAPLPGSPGTQIIGYCFWPLIQFTLLRNQEPTICIPGLRGIVRTFGGRGDVMESEAVSAEPGGRIQSPEQVSMFSLILGGSWNFVIILNWALIWSSLHKPN